jgi:hypothetical protein
VPELPVVLNEVFIWKSREQHRLSVPGIDSSDLTAGHRLKFAPARKACGKAGHEEAVLKSLPGDLLSLCEDEHLHNYPIGTRP